MNTVWGWVEQQKTVARIRNPRVRTGNRVNNDIIVERLWRSLKYEEVYLNAYRDGSEARKGIDAYLDLCNRERPHQSLGYRTPAQVFASGRPLKCLPDQQSALSSCKAVSDFKRESLLT